MPEYIEREALIKRLEASPLIKNYLIMRGSQNFINGIFDLIKRQPTADVVSSAVLEQVMWERDMALETLKEHGIGFCEKSDMVEVVRCAKCIHAEELDRHCEINRNAYRHCSLWRGDKTRNVWHKYNKYYRDYSIVDLDGFCSEGQRKEVAESG